MSDRIDPAAAAGSSSVVIDDCWNRIGVRGDRSCPELQQHVHCGNCPVQRAVAVELLAQQVPSDYTAQWTEHVSRPVRQTDGDTASAVIFRIGAEWLALPAAVIQEISNLKPIHRVPHRTSGVVLGVTNVRGELLTCVSLARVFGLEAETVPAASGGAASSGGSASPGGSAASGGAAPSGGLAPSALLARKRMLVIRRKDLRTACPVDHVDGVHRYAPAALTSVPATVAKAGTRYSRALLAWRDQTVGVLDEELLFAALKRGMA